MHCAHAAVLCAPSLFLQAIKGREEVLDRLRAATEKVDASHNGTTPFALSSTDPLVCLFFR